MFNLRSRSFLKETDFTAQEFRFLLELAAALKHAFLRDTRNNVASRCS
jgi:ornithine carbamoyltransferase